MLTMVIFGIICYYLLFLYFLFENLLMMKMISMIGFEINQHFSNI